MEQLSSRYSDAEFAAALLAPFALLPSDFTVRQSQNQSQTDESSLLLHSSHAGKFAHCKGVYAKENMSSKRDHILQYSHNI